MTTPMPWGECLLALIASWLCFGGLWRTTAQIRPMLRSRTPLPHADALARIYPWAVASRVASMALFLACGAALIGLFRVPRYAWVAIGLDFVYSLYLAGRARELLGPTIPEWLMRPDSGNYEGYDDSYRRLPVSTNPSAQVEHEEGQCRDAEGDREGAIEHYQRALAHDPEFARCVTDLGIARCGSGDLKEGRRLFLAATELAPDSAYAWHLLARAEGQLGLKEAATLHERQAAEKLDDERARESIG